MADNPLTDREQFLRWAEWPLTAAFLQFLRDRQATLAGLWAAGNLMLPEDQGKAVELGELADIKCDDLRRFYGLSEEESE